MTYEIAKKLKDAGFPIKTIPAYDNAGKNAKLVDAEFEFLAPTLSKLIEACNGKLTELKYDDTGFKLILRWAAFSDKERGDGNSPEEAVANLWLELNKK